MLVLDTSNHRHQQKKSLGGYPDPTPPARVAARGTRRPSDATPPSRHLNPTRRALPSAPPSLTFYVPPIPPSPFVPSPPCSSIPRCTHPPILFFAPFVYCVLNLAISCLSLPSLSWNLEVSPVLCSVGGDRDIVCPACGLSVIAFVFTSTVASKLLYAFRDLILFAVLFAVFCDQI